MIPPIGTHALEELLDLPQRMVETIHLVRLFDNGKTEVKLDLLEWSDGTPKHFVFGNCVSSEEEILDWVKSANLLDPKPGMYLEYGTPGSSFSRRAHRVDLPESILMSQKVRLYEYILGMPLTNSQRDGVGANFSKFVGWAPVR